MKLPTGRGSASRRITFAQATLTQGDDGQPIRSWFDANGNYIVFAKRWAMRTEVPPSVLRSERFEDQQWNAKTWVGFRIPYDKTLYMALSANEDFRLIDSDLRVYDIMSAQELPYYRRRWIDIVAWTRSDKAPVAE
jgi:hypothetical protein